MKKITAHTIGIAQGNDVLFEDFEDGGEMWTGTGHRERVKTITFREPFKAVPSVHCSPTLWDVDSATNVRADVEAENVTETGVDLVFRTWRGQGRRRLGALLKSDFCGVLPRTRGYFVGPAINCVMRPSNNKTLACAEHPFVSQLNGKLRGRQNTKPRSAS